MLKDIADEERVHAGEFLRLLKELDPEEEKLLCRRRRGSRGRNREAEEIGNNPAFKALYAKLRRVPKDLKL